MSKRIRGFTALLLLGCFLAAAGRFSAAAQPAEGWGFIRGPYLQISIENYDKYSPAVAYDSIHDDYLVVWETGEASHKIRGEWISSSGQLLSSFLISNATYPEGTFDRLNPAVIFDSITGTYLVVWAYYAATDWDIYGRYLAWNGPAASMPEFAIVTERDDQTKPKLAYNSINGDVLLVWLTSSTPDRPIEATLMHEDRTYSNLAALSAGGSDLRDFPDAAFNSGLNQYLVVWDVSTAASGLDVHGLRLDSLGNPVAPGEIAIANSAIKNEQHPAAAGCAKANQFLVVYQQTRNGATDDDIFGSFLAGNGALTGPFIVGGTTAPQGAPHVSCNYAGGEYFVAWHDMYADPQYRFGIWGKWLKPDNTSRGLFEIVAPSNLRDRLNPAVASGRSNTLAVWEHYREDLPVYRNIWGSILTENAVFWPYIKK